MVTSASSGWTRIDSVPTVRAPRPAAPDVRLAAAVRVVRVVHVVGVARRLDHVDVDVAIPVRGRDCGLPGTAGRGSLDTRTAVARPRRRRRLGGRHRPLRRRFTRPERLHLVLDLERLAHREQHLARQRPMPVEEQRHLVLARLEAQPLGQAVEVVDDAGEVAVDEDLGFPRRDLQARSAQRVAGVVAAVVAAPVVGIAVAVAAPIGRPVRRPAVGAPPVGIGAVVAVAPVVVRPVRAVVAGPVARSVVGPRGRTGADDAAGRPALHRSCDGAPPAAPAPALSRRVSRQQARRHGESRGQRDESNW